MPGPGRAPSPRTGVLLMIAATILWGGTFVIARDALATVPPVTLIVGRFAVAGTLLAGIALVRRRPAGRATIVAGLLSAPFTAAGYALQASGLTETSAGSSAFLTSAGTLMVAPFAWLFLRQRPGAIVWAGIALALLGSALLSWRTGFRFGRGELVTLLGATAYAVALVIVAARIERIEPVALTAVQTLAGAAVLLPFARALPPGVATPATLARFAYLAIAGSLIAPLLQVTAQRSLTPARIGILFALEPVFAVVFAVLFGAERFGLRWWAGALLILTAVGLVEWQPASSSPAPPTPRPATT
jgi:drug/metabolite transporter (DMT)-like permease